ncbi:hypothetical protein VNI00_009199 [Paramarasmius palmivorus]|uniref:Cytochrome P450 n=1 Tax=Paramarasmius palmivorus TaxID=297713 RepID=A0AAW0CNV7_9AGAR
MPSVLVLLLAVLSVLLYRQARPKKKLPPGPKGYPLVGNLLQLDADRPWHTLVKWKKEYGDIMYLRLANQDVIVLNTAKAAGDLLDRRAANYSQRPRVVILEYLTGGLLLVFMGLGTIWRKMHRAAHETLNIRAVARYYPLQMREGIRLAIDMLETPEKSRDHCHRLAGYDTTAGALTWLILAMVRFPEVQSKAQEELDEVVGRSKIPTLADMDNLPYMRAIIKEVLRWRPPTPISVFHAALEVIFHATYSSLAHRMKDDVYEGYHIPKGSLIIPNVL